MAKYVVIKKFKDDDGKVYEKGDFYKRNNKKRIDVLSTKNNKVGEVFIVEVVEPKSEEKKEEKEPKKGKGSKKK